MKPLPLSANKDKLFEGDNAKLISNFVDKCLVDVGFNDKGESKSGYICVFCDKIFK